MHDRNQKSSDSSQSEFMHRVNPIMQWLTHIRGRPVHRLEDSNYYTSSRGGSHIDRRCYLGFHETSAYTTTTGTVL